MDLTTPLFLLLAVAFTRSESLSEVLNRRSHFGMYASDFTNEYEPFAIAAIPLHSPIPVLQILSHAPLASDRPHYSQPQLAASMRHPVYAPLIKQPTYSKPSVYKSQESEATVLYARPNKSGGYIYNKRPTKKRKPPKNIPQKEPIIIRVHKYRIIKSR